MRGYSGHGFHFDSHAQHSETLLHAAERYFTEIVVFWLMGICFMAGWTFGTAGTVEVARCVADGVAVVVVGLIAGEIGRRAGLKFEGLTPGVALAMAVIVIEMSAPLGLVTSAIWNAIGGSFPDKSELGNKLIASSSPVAISYVDWKV